MDKENTHILALDMASRTTGYAIYNGGKIIAHGAWKISQRQPFKDLADKITRALQKFEISEIVAEDIYNSQDTRLQSAFDTLSKCHGVLNLISEKTAIPLTLIDPRQAKREMWGYTNARPSYRTMPREEQKARMIRAVERLGYTLITNRNGNKSDDQADAIGILITFLKGRKLPIAHPASN